MATTESDWFRRSTGSALNFESSRAALESYGRNGRLSCMLWLALAFVGALQAEIVVAADSAAPMSGTEPDPWAFNLTLYGWFPGMRGNVGAGPLSKSVDVNFVDLVGKLSNFPMAFNGRFEAHYQRLGFYLDGNYLDVDLAIPRNSRGPLSTDLAMTLGVMDYGLMYRLFGPAPNEMAAWAGKVQPNRLDVYVGGRTIWMDNTITPPLSAPSVSASTTLTAPLIGGRFLVDITPDWFLLADGNLGGFGADGVDFTGVLHGMVGYRTTFFDVPTSLEVGYRALRINAKSGRAAMNMTMDGPLAGLTLHW